MAPYPNALFRARKGMEQFFSSESGTIYRLNPDNGPAGHSQRFETLEPSVFSELPSSDASAFSMQYPSIDQCQLTTTTWHADQPVDWSLTHLPYIPYSSPPACINTITTLQDASPPFVPSDPTPGAGWAPNVPNPAPSAPTIAPRKHHSRIAKGKPSARRVVFSAAQNRALSALYERVANVRLPEREVFGRAIGLNEMQVKIWLQNRRYKEKKSRPAEDVAPWKYDKHYETERVIQAIEYSVAVYNHTNAGFPLPPPAFQPRPSQQRPGVGLAQSPMDNCSLAPVQVAPNDMTCLPPLTIEQKQLTEL